MPICTEVKYDIKDEAIIIQIAYLYTNLPKNLL